MNFINTPNASQSLQVYVVTRYKFIWKNDTVNCEEIVSLTDEAEIRLIYNDDDVQKNVLSLESRGSTAGEVRASLWYGAFIALLYKGFTFTAGQCANKWKNIKQNHNKAPKFQYKLEVENILDKKKLEVWKFDGREVRSIFDARSDSNVNNINCGNLAGTK
ncbi:3714_t:CDS:2 [Funneliformis geosporum]|uniref:3714_t:CDS:1 n=1 Tax=Funneliformis geosporum TaxID=1117311 RepID=A0A9W4SKD0_9GLOM|nr:3714_t:CDS:2 [Funneliformis geosporum]